MTYKVEIHDDIALQSMTERNITQKPGQNCLPKVVVTILLQRKPRRISLVMQNATLQNTHGAEIISLPAAKKDKRRDEHKYSAPVMKHGYTMLPNLLLQAQGRLNISHAQFNVLVQLIGHWWDADKEPHPAKDTIAQRMEKPPAGSALPNRTRRSRFNQENRAV